MANSFFSELKRRNVFKVAIAYLVVGWLAIQVIVNVTEPLALPDWAPSFVIVLLAIGFPIALIFAWAFELTSDGIKKSKDVDQDSSITHLTSRKIDFIIIGALVLIIGGLVYERMNISPPQSIETANTPINLNKASIAVLPFADMSPENNQVYFSDGISDEILNVLAQVEGLHVTSRSSAFQFRGNDIHIPTVAETLGVEHILEGSVRKSGNNIRVTAQLIEAASDKHLWSATFDRALTTENIFAIQSDIANAIVTEMGDKIGIKPYTESIHVDLKTADLSTYETYLKGKETFMNRASYNDLATSIELLENVTTSDPLFAEAWLWLAASYAVAPSWAEGDDLFIQNYSEYFARSKKSAERTLELDPSLTFAHSVLAYLLRYEENLNWNDIINGYKKALKLEPDNPTTHLWLALVYLDLGFLELATTHVDRCLAISPLYINCLDHKSNIEEYMGNITNAEILREKKHTLAPATLYDTVRYTLTSHSPRLIRQGQLVAARYMIQSNLKNVETFPVSDWINAIQNPSDNHDAFLDKIEVWAATTELRSDVLGLIYLSIGAWDKVPIYKSIYNNPPLWFSEHVGYRQSDNFKTNIRNFNIDDYWREHGFPPQCRSIGEDDFECD
ncbi:MAG: tetratricopeptide repeat protein [Gammaproteobacteria bacterium]|nr:tetratricopeptide repeat protein [Gammaproteobacteria bacterium]